MTNTQILVMTGSHTHTHLENISVRITDLNITSYSREANGNGGRKSFSHSIWGEAGGKGRTEGRRVEAAVRASNRKHIQKSLNECTSSAMCECVVWERDRGSNGTDLSLRMCSWGERVMRLSRVRCTGFVRQREFEKGGFLCNWHPMLETPSVRAHTHTHTHTPQTLNKGVTEQDDAHSLCLCTSDLQIDLLIRSHEYTDNKEENFLSLCVYNQMWAEIWWGNQGRNYDCFQNQPFIYTRIKCWFTVACEILKTVHQDILEPKLGVRLKTK